MYALATIPLIKKLEGNYKQIWYADDAAAVGKITELRKWWDKLTTAGPVYGYFPKASKDLADYQAGRTAMLRPTPSSLAQV